MALTPDDLGLTAEQKNLLREKLESSELDVLPATVAAAAAAKTKEEVVSQDVSEVVSPKIKTKTNPKGKVL